MNAREDPRVVEGVAHVIADRVDQPPEQAGVLVEHAVVPDLVENFYAITVPRRFAPPLVRELLARPEKEVLGTA